MAATGPGFVAENLTFKRERKQRPSKFTPPLAFGVAFGVACFSGVSAGGWTVFGTGLAFGSETLFFPKQRQDMEITVKSMNRSSLAVWSSGMILA